MTVLILLLARDFGVCTPQLREEKHWIVAKTAGALVRLRDNAFDRIRQYSYGAPVLRESGDANKACLAIVAIQCAHFPQ